MASLLIGSGCFSNINAFLKMGCCHTQNEITNFVSSQGVGGWVGSGGLQYPKWIDPPPDRMKLREIGKQNFINPLTAFPRTVHSILSSTFDEHWRIGLIIMLPNV
jgi:hypothetical protein